MGYNQSIGGKMIPYNSDIMHGSDDWKRLSTFQFPDGLWHLHSRYLKGAMVWVLSGRRSPICKLEGRCRIVEIKTIETGDRKDVL